MPYIDVESVGRMYYEEFGEGPTLLQIHGLGVQGFGLQTLTDILARRVRCVNIHMPGYGNSCPPPRSASVSDAADDVAAFIRAYVGGPVTVHGTSLGAVVAIILAGRHADVVDRLIVTAALPRSDKAAIQRRRLWRAVLDLGDLGVYADVVGETGFGREFYERPDADEWLERRRDAYRANAKNAAAWRDGISSLQDMDAMQFAPMIAAPTLCISGGDDTMTPAVTGASGAGFKVFSEAVADGRLAIVPGAGHYILFEKPEETAELMVNFMKHGG